MESYSGFIDEVPHSLIAGCTSSTTIARTTSLPWMKSGRNLCPLTELRGQRSTDIVQFSWSLTWQGAKVDALRIAGPLAKQLHALKLTISSKTIVVAHDPALASQVLVALRRLGVPAKSARRWLDCEVFLTGEGKRAIRISQACRTDRRAATLPATGIYPTQAYGRNPSEPL